ncbi:hypothetical protein R1sor_016877 [Riccia sorocarpa]|uniref:Rieske domain-containing protein n=1 Tax=Riccia sorocarpa TaxID=122646 RepID=A0ABD3HGQ2_9MARC
MARAIDAVSCQCYNATLSRFADNSGGSRSVGNSKLTSAGSVIKSSFCGVKLDPSREWHPRKSSKGTAWRAHIGPTPQTTPEEHQQVQAEARRKTAVPGLRDTIWDQLNQAVPSNKKLSESTSADVLVVGAGIAGICVAYNLAKAGKKVVVLEARAIGSGQTGKRSGQLMSWNDDFYHILENNFGEDKLRLVGESHRESINWIERVVQEEGIDCDFRRVPGYLVTKDDSEEEAHKLRKEYEASKRAGFTDAKLENLKNDTKHGKWGMALVFPNTGEFDPLRFTQGLAKVFKEKYGGHIYEETSVVDHNVTTATTSEGHKVSAEAVVLATNSPITRNVVLHGRQYGSRTYLVGLKAPSGRYTRASWWDTGKPYHYVRLVEQGDHDVLLVGGEDHHSGIYPSEYDPTYEKLEEWARTHWPEVEEVVYRWTGQMLHPADYLGLYGRDLFQPNSVYIATGDSGQGNTGGIIAGITISSEILGRNHPWSSLYNPNRFPPVTVQVAQQELDVLKDDFEGFKNLLPFQAVDSLSAETVGRNCGAVIQEGIRKVAVYRDDGGRIHRYSAICPHLGCVVKWNPKDSTFDCPCHGSYFDHNGVVINAPSSVNLEPLSDN